MDPNSVEVEAGLARAVVGTVVASAALQRIHQRRRKRPVQEKAGVFLEELFLYWIHLRVEGGSERIAVGVARLYNLAFPHEDSIIRSPPVDHEILKCLQRIGINEVGAVIQQESPYGAPFGAGP